MIIDGHLFSDGRLGLRSCLPGMQIGAYACAGPPEPFEEDVVEAASLAVHPLPSSACFHAREGESRTPVLCARFVQGEGGEPRALLPGQDLGRAELVDDLVQSLDTVVILP